jgi:predicted transcriptional regulator
LRDEANTTHQLKTHPKSNDQEPIEYNSAERTPSFFPGVPDMKKTTIAVLDGRELNYATLLEGTGMSRSTARTIVCLMIRPDLTVREISRATEMSSAMTRVALRKLGENGMVLTGTIIPEKVSERRYRLVGGWDCILARIEQRECDKISGYLEKTGKARKNFRELYG